MPKIPWTPPSRPPRIAIPEYVPPVEMCKQCVGEGVLYKNGAKGEPQTEIIECWVCKGSGEALPEPGSPGDPFMVRDAFMRRYHEVFPETIHVSHTPQF